MSRVPHLLWCECLCGKGRTAAARTEQVSIKGGTIRTAEILFEVDLSAPAGQHRAIIVGKKPHNLRALFFRPVNEVGVGPVLERLACVSSQWGGFVRAHFANQTRAHALP